MGDIVLPAFATALQLERGCISQLAAREDLCYV